MGKIYNLAAPSTGQIQSMDDVRQAIDAYDRAHPPESYFDQRLREKRETKAREAKALERQQTDNLNTWAAIDARITEHLDAHDEEYSKDVGKVIGIKSCEAYERAHDEMVAEAAKRAELTSVENSLHTELRSQLDRVTDTHLDFYRDFYEKVETLGERVARAGVEIQKVFDATITGVRQEIAELRDIQLKAGRVPVVKTWQPESVTYQTEFVCHEGTLWQACKDNCTSSWRPRLDLRRARRSRRLRRQLAEASRRV